MPYCNRLGHLVAIVILGLGVLCAPAQSQVFSAPKNASNNSDFSFTPQVAVDLAGNIYLVWEDDTDTNSNILFSRSTDGGATFSAPKNISNSSGFSFNPSIAVDTHGSINVAWEDNTPSNLDVMYSRSTDAGLTFSTPINVSHDPADSASPQIAVDTSGNIFIVWENDTLNLGIAFSRSTDGGITFSAPAILSINAAGSVSPQLAVDLGGNISVVWEDDTLGHSDITFSRSADHGATFSTPMSLSNNVGNSLSPQLTVDLAGDINVAWESESPGNSDIIFSRSADKGVTFSAPMSLSSSLGQSRNPQIALDAGGNVNVVWTDNNPSNLNPDIFFARSKDGGITFSIPQNLSQNSGLSSIPRLIVDAGGNIDVVWEDNTPGNRDIFFTRSADSGATFSTPLNLSNDSGLSSAARLVADKNANINVAWQDNTPGISQIFFSRFSSGTVANHPPIANAGVDQTLECAGPGGTPVTLNGSNSSDPDGDVLSFVWKDESNNVVGTTAVVQLTLAMGTHTFTLTVTDSGGLSATATTLVTIRDTAPPTLRVTLSPNVLWPPNHRLVQITATVQTSDGCDANPAVALVSITSNEPDNGLGDGDQPNDIQAVGGGAIPFGTDVRAFLLRAERSGSGAGRIYTVNYMVRDASGNESLASAQVLVGSQTSNVSLKRSGRDLDGKSDHKSDRTSDRKRDRESNREKD